MSNTKDTMTGIELIAQERKEQIEKHGRTIEQDVALNDIEAIRWLKLNLFSNH